MKKILLIMAIATLASCSKTEVTPPIGEDVIALRSRTLDASGAFTRAPFEGTISTENALTVRVLTSLATDFSTNHADGTMTFTGTGAVPYDVNPTGNPKFDNAIDNHYLFGLYPAATNWAHTAGESTAVATFTGKEDIMAAARVTTVKDDVANATYKTLSFRHLLTKLEVKVSATAIAIDLFGEIKSIKLVGATGGTEVVNELTFNASTSTNDAMVVTPSAAALTSMDFYLASANGENKKTYTETPFTGQAYTLTTTPSLVAYSMVAPVNATVANTEEYYLEVETEEMGVRKISVDLLKDADTKFDGNTAGNSFTIALTFRSLELITVDVEVAEWIENGEYQGEITG